MPRITLPKRQPKKHHPEVVTGNFQLHYEELVRKNRYLVLAILSFGIAGLSAVVPYAAYHSSATPIVVGLEVENTNAEHDLNILFVKYDSTASGNSYIQFSATPLTPTTPRQSAP